MEGTPMLRSASAFVGAALMCLPLAACSQGQQGEVDTPMFSAVRNSPASVAAESPTEEAASPEPTSNQAPAPKTEEPESCEDIDAEEAYQSGIGTIAPWNGFGWGRPFSSEFDPCADLSWLIIAIEGATASSPHHIMLFHKGEYLGTATAEPYGFFPTIERVNDAEIAVTYHWAREGETTAGRTGETHAGFRWDEGQQKVIMSGDVPPHS